MKNIAIIPARGGSKRLNNKNVRIFHGKPIITYAIETALATNLFDIVMVSTDCPKIAAISKKQGAIVPFLRSSHNSTDYAPTIDVLREVIEYYINDKIRFDNILCLYPCSPLLRVSTLKSAWDKFNHSQSDSLFSVMRYSHPPERGLSILDNSYLKPKDLNAFKLRTQDIKDTFHDAGCFYYLKTCLLSKESLLTTNTTFFELSPIEAQDIDNQFDWDMAELKYELQQRTNFRGLSSDSME